MKGAPQGTQLGSRHADRIDAFLWLQVLKQGFHGGSVVKNPPANAGVAGSIPGRKTPWRRWQHTSELLPGKSHEQRSLGGSVHGVTVESDTS